MEPSSKHPCQEKTIRLVGYAFVDHTDFIQTAKDGQNLGQVLVKLQEAINMWEGLIQASGGALAVHKGQSWAIHFKWNNGQWAYRTMNEINATISANNLKSTRLTKH